LPESWKIVEEWIDNSKDAIEIVQKGKEEEEPQHSHIRKLWCAAK
jgi:hypothetical protein